ncbi:MAG: hypothetical protein PWQ79_698 [Thermococcaceae archaeon]|nr:hypothetical protein [Thermococcaceae archaeon]MDK2913783.1 hypothetical protein [Thermococcaceae archaeon]
METFQAAARISTGVEGLDRMLNGGLIPGRSYLVKGAPGTGKTTLAMHFAMAGVSNGENVLFVTLEEPLDNLRADMLKLGFNVDDPRLEIIDATPASDNYVLLEDYFESFAKSLERLTDTIKQRMAIKRYSRIVVDPITILKLASGNEMDYRKSFLSFVKSMMKMKVTVLLTSELQRTDVEEYIVGGIIELRNFEIDGFMVRGIKITKFRGSDFDKALRPYEISDRGIVVYTDKVVNPAKSLPL